MGEQGRQRTENAGDDEVDWKDEATTAIVAVSAGLVAVGQNADK